MIRFGAYIEGDEVVYTDYPKVSGIRKRELSPGGIIVLSADVTNMDEHRIKRFIKTHYQRFFRKEKVDKVILDVAGKDTTGWSIGQFFDGRYNDPNSDMVFNERSFSVEIIGQSFSFIEDVAGKLMYEFEQMAVLVKDYSTNKFYIFENDDIIEEELEKEACVKNSSFMGNEGYWINYKTDKAIEISEHMNWIRMPYNAKEIGVSDAVIDQFKDYPYSKHNRAADREKFMSFIMGKAPLVRVRGYRGGIVFEYNNRNTKDVLDAIYIFGLRQLSDSDDITINNLATKEQYAMTFGEFKESLDDGGAEAVMRVSSEIDLTTRILKRAEEAGNYVMSNKYAR